MQIELLYDAGALAKLATMDHVKGELRTLFGDSITLATRYLGDPYADYQVQGRINPRAVYQQYRTYLQDEKTLRLVLTGYDLAPPQLNYSYGVTWRGVASVVSTHRLGGSLAVAIIGIHELLHQIGLVGESQPQYDHRTGMDGHCRNRCIMRAANGPQDLHVMMVDWQNGVRLCSQCAGL